MLQHLNSKCRSRPVIQVRASRSRLHTPADLRGVGHRLTVEPDQDDRDAGLFRSELQSSAGRQIDGAGRFQDDGGQRCATRAFKRGSQGAHLRARLHDNQAIRRNAEPRQSRAIGVSRLSRGRGLAHPQQSSVIRSRCEPLSCQRQTKANGRAGASRAGDNLMQSSAVRAEFADISRWHGVF